MPAVSRAQQKFFGIVRAIQKGEMAPTTPETAKADADMKKSDVKDFASTKHKKLPEKKVAKEAAEDSLRDRRMERGGVDGNNRYNSAPKNVAMGGGKKKPYDGMSALDYVKADIRKKHGKGAIMDTKNK